MPLNIPFLVCLATPPRPFTPEITLENLNQTGVDSSTHRRESLTPINPRACQIIDTNSFDEVHLVTPTVYLQKKLACQLFLLIDSFVIGRC